MRPLRRNAGRVEKIKKGFLKKITVKHDWYGYYYHNINSEPTYKEEYHNWIEHDGEVRIVCHNGEYDDDPEENKKNPLYESSYEYWDDQPND